MVFSLAMDDLDSAANAAYIEQFLPGYWQGACQPEKSTIESMTYQIAVE
jgi:hypothetical protein